MANWGKILARGNVEDRRSFAPAAFGGISLTGVAVIMLVQFMLGGNPADILSQLESLPVETQRPVDTEAFKGEDSYEVFASTVLGSNNQMWEQALSRSNYTYLPPKLVLFRTATQSGCGTATSAVGPHYCPLDKTIYLDETFFEELTQRFGAKGGDVAQAYVIAHEVAHHVQNELGIMKNVHESGSDQTEQNQLSIKLELQADCFAGLWAYSIKDQGILEPGEIEEAIDAAAAVGDDRIQEKVTGYTQPESWTHGSSTQRVSWFNKGYESGTIRSCDTFQ